MEKEGLVPTLNTDSKTDISYEKPRTIFEQYMSQGLIIVNFNIKGKGSKIYFTNVETKEFTGSPKNKYFIDFYKNFREKLLIFRRVSNELENNFRKECEFEFSGDAVLLPPNQNLLPNYFIMKSRAGMFYLRSIKPLEGNDNNVITCHLRAFAFKHTNLLALLGWCKINNQLYYVYQYEAEHLDYYLERKTEWTVKEVYDFVKHLIQGILYLNERSMHYHSEIVFVHDHVPIFGFELIDGDNQNEMESKENDRINICQIVQKIKDCMKKSKCNENTILELESIISSLTNPNLDLLNIIP